MEITIAHLYPDLLNLYGDKGNITTLKRRLECRNITAHVKEYELDDEIDFENSDIIFIGGGSDREQKLVCERLCEFKDKLISYAENNGVIIAVCGGYQLLGKYYKLNNETINGIGLLDIYTEQGKDRLIGNIVLESKLIGDTIVGFENHGGRTYIGKHQPLGNVIHGYGNNEKDFCEGVIYKNVIATYLHGPLLPKNPKLADYILNCALKNKYPEAENLSSIDDTYEELAHDYVLKRFCK